MADDSGASEQEVAPPPAMPIRTAIYVTPDGHVRFGALFEELVPVARALDPSLPVEGAPPVRSDPE